MITEECLYSITELISKIKTYSGCDKVKLVGSKKSFDELTALGFPLSNFKCEEVNDERDDPMLYVIPIES